MKEDISEESLNNHFEVSIIFRINDLKTGEELPYWESPVLRLYLNKHQHRSIIEEVPRLQPLG